MSDYETRDWDERARHPRDTLPGPRRKRRWRFRRWLIALPFTLVVLLGVAWSAGWTVLAGRLQTEVEAWIAREAEAGRIYACASRDVGGYPFRLELVCTEPSLRIGEGEGAIVATASRLHAAAQIYDWRLGIAEIEGPARIAIEGVDDAVVADWTLAQASYRGDDVAMGQTALVFDGLTIDTGGPDVVAPAADATRVGRAELHLRPSEGGTAGGRDFDVALSATGIDAAGQTGGAISLLSTARAVPENWTGTQDLLRRWQQAGGAFAIGTLNVDWGEFRLRGSGNLALDEQGRAVGDVTADIAGIELLIDAVPEEVSPGDMGALVGSALSLVGQSSTIDGRDATRLQLALVGGQVRLGPFALIDLPPLY